MWQHLKRPKTDLNRFWGHVRWICTEMPKLTFCLILLTLQFIFLSFFLLFVCLFIMLFPLCWFWMHEWNVLNVLYGVEKPPLAQDKLPSRETTCFDFGAVWFMALLLQGIVNNSVSSSEEDGNKGKKSEQELKHLSAQPGQFSGIA